MKQRIKNKKENIKFCDLWVDYMKKISTFNQRI